MTRESNDAAQIDVLVVGAGPVGLLAAIELALGGARVHVVERLARPSTTAKALMVGALGCEALARRGMEPAMADAEQRTMALMQKARELGGADAPRGGGGKFSGHFGGLTLLRTEVQPEPHRRGRPIDQQSVEAMLEVRAHALGIVVQRGCEVTDIMQDGHGVGVSWHGDGGEGVIRCAWLVACDGGRSLIRKRAGIGFPGTPPTLTMYQATVTLDDPSRLLPGWQRTDSGVYSYGFLPNRLIMLDFSGPPADRAAPVTAAEVENVVRRISGADVRVTGMAAGSRWTDNTRLADSYRHGRVFLAGDAAHIHSPFGGQGMSLGLVDAANLGWKLAAVIRGNAPDTLLDTYTAERRPVAEAVLDNTRAQAAIMRPDAQSGAMRRLMARLLDFDDVNAFVGGMMSGLATRYDLDTDQDPADNEWRDRIGQLIGNRPVSEHGCVTSLYEVMQGGAGVFVDTSGNAARAAQLAVLAPRLRYVEASSGPSLLIRPDACIAWAGEIRGDDHAEPGRALQRWFGVG